MKRLLFVALIVVICLTSATTDRRPTLFLIGDSTMADKDESNGKLERGWGMALPCYFNDELRVENHAVNGRSSKSFIDEGRWDVVVHRIKPGDYVVIQFGHNDEKPQAERHTDPGSTFDYNLARFIRETREAGGIPVVMNAVVRRNFAPAARQGNDDEALRSTNFAQGSSAAEGDSLIDTHGLYAVAPRDVARRMHAHFVDANRLTHNLEQGLGPVESRKLHMWFEPGIEPSVPEGRKDNTHYNIYGAHTVARLLADALCEEIPVLKAYRIDPYFTVDKGGHGQFMSVADAVANVPSIQKATIYVMSGTWEKPKMPAHSKIDFFLREGAAWR